MKWIELKWSSVVYSIRCMAAMPQSDFSSGIHWWPWSRCSLSMYQLRTSKTWLLLQVKVAVVQLADMLSLPLWSSLIFFFCRQYWDHHQLSCYCLYLWSWWASVCNSQLLSWLGEIIFQEEQIESESDLFRTWWWSWGWFGCNSWVNAKLEGKVASLEEVRILSSQNMKLLLEHSPDLTRLLVVARTEMRKRKKTRTRWNQGQGVSFHNLILLKEMQ